MPTPIAYRFALIAGGVVAAAACLVLLIVERSTLPPGTPSSQEPPTKTAAEASDPRSSLGDAKTVRLLVRPHPKTDALHSQDHQVEIEGDVLVGEYEHLGLIDPGLRDSFLSNCATQIRDIEARLSKDRDTSSSKAMVAEADDFLRLITLNREKAALLSGTYITTRPGSPQPPLSLPGAEVIQTSGLVNGEPVELTYVFPLDSDAELKSAREYRHAIQMFDESEKARKFNSLPDDERLKIAERLGQILRNPQPSQEDSDFLFETLGWSNTLDAATGLVRIRPQ